MNREDLERQALESVCSCYYYELSNDIHEVSDQDLKDIIDLPYILHIKQQLEQPQDIMDFIAELKECTESKPKQDLKVFNDFLGMDVQKSLDNLTIRSK